MKKLLTLLATLLVGMGLAAQNTMEEDLDLQYAVDLLKPGTQAPDFALQDIQGKTYPKRQRDLPRPVFPLHSGKIRRPCLFVTRLSGQKVESDSDGAFFPIFAA